MGKLSNIWAVSKVMLKTGAQSQMKRRKGGRTSSSKSVLIFVILLFLIMGGLFFMSSYEQLRLHASGETSAYLGDYLSVNAMGLITFIMGFTLIFILNFLFLSKDNDFFVALPITSGEIYLGRLLSSLINVYVLELVFVLPFFVAFDIVYTPHWTAYLNQIVLLLVNPIILTSLIFLFFLLLARIFNISKNRKVVNRVLLTIGLVISIVGFMYYSFTSSLASSLGGSEEIEAFVKMLALLKHSTNWLMWYREPFAISFTGGLIRGLPYKGVIATLIFIAIGAFLLVISYFVARRFYAPVLLGSNEGIAKRSKKSLDDELIKQKQSSVMRELINKEFKTIFRSGTFFSQLILPYFIMLPAFLVSLFASFFSGDGGSSLHELRALISTLPSEFLVFIGFILLAGIAFFSSMVLPSATAISREGPNAYLMKIISVPIKKQLYAKMLIGILISGVTTSIIELVLLILLGFKWYFIILMLLSSLLIITLINYLMILIDLKRPMLNWREEIVAVKQNINILLSILIGLGFAVLFGLIAIGIYFIEMPAWLIILIGVSFGLVLPGLALFITNYFVSKKGPRLLVNIE